MFNQQILLQWGLLSRYTILRIGLESDNLGNGFPSSEDELLLFILRHHMIR
ncbi:hypothetical protein Lalb_Chr07g0194641 [Lupinus albus]|uniref:Uncharacterized protein n=1 Tax=Lupinus albus TaxID=3870 RepID=A0A6A4QC07_LUPAL|nr:hypothetical protein Lalb_Chr07g0194641 [Lupinus albus]